MEQNKQNTMESVVIEGSYKGVPELNQLFRDKRSCRGNVNFLPGTS